MKIQSTEYLLSVGASDQFPKSGFPEIAFAGRSNVGKSSLLNRLLNRKGLAKISNTPGKTRTLNFYSVNGSLHFVDLPGYGFAQRGRFERKSWAKLIDGYLNDGQYLRGILQLMDARHDPSQADLEMLSWLLHFKRPFLVVATKADKLSGSRLKPRIDRTRSLLGKFGEVEVVPFSATTGRGREEVWRWIQNVVYG